MPKITSEQQISNALEQHKKYKLEQEEEQRAYVDEFIKAKLEADKFINENDTICKTKSRIVRKPIQYISDDSDDDEKQTINQQPIINLNTNIQEIEINDNDEVIEQPKQKLISVKPAPYDLKPSNGTIRIKQLEQQLYEMTSKYNKQIEINKKLQMQNTECKVATEFYNKYNTTTATKTNNNLENFMKQYEITNERTDKIKCSDLLALFKQTNNTYTSKTFIKALGILGINTCIFYGYTHFYGIKPLTISN
jgi:hypothetical protein